MTDHAWREYAACQNEGPELFFGPDGEQPLQRDRREQRAKRICRRCPVLDACRDYALARPERYGVWGGLGEDDRVAILSGAATREAAVAAALAGQQVKVRRGDREYVVVELYRHHRMRITRIAWSLCINRETVRRILTQTGALATASRTGAA